MASIPARTVDWQPLRDAFITRANRPTYDELAVEFAVSQQGVCRCASDEGWPALRARWLESQLQAADASAVLLSVVRGDRTVTTAYLALAVVTLATLQATVEKVRDSGKAESTIADCVNTCMFAAKNLADSLRSVGILGTGKLLAEGAQKENGRWNPEMLQQINVTVQNLQASAAANAALEPTLTKVEPVPVQAEKPVE